MQRRALAHGSAPCSNHATPAQPLVSACRHPHHGHLVMHHHHHQQQQHHHHQPRRHATHQLVQGRVDATTVGIVCRAAHIEQQQLQQQQEAATSGLEQLLVWLVGNGVQGIGRDDSLLSLYEDAGGDRGILAEQDLPAGQVLLRVPLRLAITDVMCDEERRRVVGEGALWQDRLVAKLLQERQNGWASAWAPYLQALPQRVPSALDSFGAAEAEQVQLPGAVAAIKRHAAAMRKSWASCRPDAIAAAGLDAYAWAHTIVMSRTFGNASESGGVGVRMCVPLIDMLNHAGDEAVGGLLSSGQVVSRDNVRWDVVGPDNASNGTGGWEMALTATQAIPAGAPLLLSYREGSNDEFLLNYGFVPPSNPHDTVQLFSCLSAALEQLYQQELSQGRTADELRPLFQAAHDAGLAALQQDVAAAAAAAGGADDWGQLLAALEPIAVASGSRVSGPLIAALEVLQGGDVAAVSAAVATLAWQQLQALPTSLLFDLAWLTQDALQTGDEEQTALWGGLLRHYVQALGRDFEPELQQQLEAAAGAAGRAKKKRAVPGPAGAQMQQQQQQQQPAVSAAGLPLQVLVSTVLQQQQQQQQGAVDDDSSPADAPPGQQQQQQQDAQQLPVPPGCRLSAVRVATQFRATKKLLLTDVLLAAPRERLRLGQLREQRQLLAQFRASAAFCNTVISSIDSDGEGPVLPWE